MDAYIHNKSIKQGRKNTKQKKLKRKRIQVNFRITVNLRGERDQMGGEQRVLQL